LPYFCLMVKLYLFLLNGDSVVALNLCATVQYRHDKMYRLYIVFWDVTLYHPSVWRDHRAVIFRVR
jgi:hypothetical protein